MVEIAEGEGAQPFNPAALVGELRDRTKYMKVDSRVVWFRHDYPHGIITQEAVRITDELAIFKTRVEDGEGGVAEGYGSETSEDFRDHIEKAATKSLGRALASLGYGTKGALLEGEVADSPVDDAPPDVGSQRRRATEGDRRPAEPTANRRPATREPATERQIKFVWAIAREAGLEPEETEEWSRELYGVTTANLARQQASQFIETLQRRRDDRR